MGSRCVPASPVFGRWVEGRLCMTTEAACPVCGLVNLYRHVDSHYSMGRLYACEHAESYTLGEDGSFESMSFVVPDGGIARTGIPAQQRGSSSGAF